jgi:phosphatidylserine/phosphatidylglycerophosphate/cardiolipin synthase-like enzyme
MQALTRATDRGVKGRIYLDGTQFTEREPTRVFQDLAQTPGVEIRVKRENSALMHLKCYEIDGHLLRTGSANFSASGEKRQDNDLIVIKDPQAAAIANGSSSRMTTLIVLLPCLLVCRMLQSGSRLAWETLPLPGSVAAAGRLHSGNEKLRHCQPYWTAC